jgi:hypothetical protein
MGVCEPSVFSRSTGDFGVFLMEFLLTGDDMEAAEAGSTWAIINLHFIPPPF